MALEFPTYLGNTLQALAARLTAAEGKVLPAATQAQALEANASGSFVAVTPPWGGGDYYRPGYYSWGTFAPAFAATTLTVNVLYARPFIVPVRRSFDRLGCNVSTAATAGGLLRMGLYAPGQGVPGALLVDAGTVDSTTTGAKELTISQTLNPGLYYVAIVAQTVGCVIGGLSQSTGNPWGNSLTPPTGVNISTHSFTLAAGAVLPTTYTPTGYSSLVPGVCLRAT